YKPLIARFLQSKFLNTRNRKKPNHHRLAPIEATTMPAEGRLVVRKAGIPYPNITRTFRS
ncbi:hypothetical protein, partial [Flavobacterium sedimenticola]